MRLAILGATSEIAKDLVQSFAAHGHRELMLYARRPDAVSQWLLNVGLVGRYSVADFAAFSADEHFDVVLNFVGVGDPALAVAMGSAIFDVTLKYDELALDYVRNHPTCRYIFLSSGAIFGGDFAAPVTADTAACVQPNCVRPDAWYGLAKLNAEIAHRRFHNLAIVDLRVFNYFSEGADIRTRFLITDILRSIRENLIFETSSTNITRDYIGPNNFVQMVQSIINSQPINIAVDFYTKKPVGKIEMLEAFKKKFGLKYRLINRNTGINAIGSKTNYYSTNYLANEIFGYTPETTALQGVMLQAEGFFHLGDFTPQVKSF